MSQEIVEKIFHKTAEIAPHISSGLKNRREYAAKENPSGETQIEADIWANEFFKEAFTSIEGIGEFASEEEKDIVDCGGGVSVTIDPLDGSSNIPSNNIVGTIIGIYDKELPCSGRDMVASIVVVYGPLTTILRAEEGEVHEYVLERKESDGVELHLSREQIHLEESKVYGFGGREYDWTEKFKEFAEEVKENHKLRYGGALVGDVNQVLYHGGVFAYPELNSRPNGKLRLMFEANPMAFIFENSGGASSNGQKSILDIEPNSLHQRTPLYLANKALISLREEKN